MIPRLDIQFPFCRQWQYWFGNPYEPHEGEYLLNHARSGIVLALRASLPNGGRAGVVTYNCHTVANAVVNTGCTPVFIDVTDELKINVEALPADLDAIVVTNLFGIRNDISAIRAKCPKAIIIVDNAHGYGLPAEGDFTVYSINQGKFPALGPGGILVVNLKENKNTENTVENNKDNNDYLTKKEESEPIGISSNNLNPKSAQKQVFGQPSAQSCSVSLTDSFVKNDSLHESQKNAKKFIEAIEEQYAALPGYGFFAQVKLFCSMLIKAMAYSRCFYWLTRLLKRELGVSGLGVKGKVVMKKMAPGIRRLYNAWLPSADEAIAAQKQNAEAICNLQSAIFNLQSSIFNLQSSIFNLQSSISNLKYLIGDNAFMLIARCENPEELKTWFADRGVETATHFAHAIDWATEFGYLPSSCPKAEKLTKHLLMIPTYVGLGD